ncbi:MAG: 50S ribosomal protein L4 [Candidatus Paceibacterota bacterium]
MKENVYNQKGEKKGTVELPESIFCLPWNGDLVHQVLFSMFTNARIPLASTKGRSDVRGGGRKPWRQKGTGRARHGSRRSPLWRGGGVTFGPGGENFVRKINRKMRRKALFVLLSRRLKENNLLFVEALSFKKPQTGEAKALIETLSKISGFEEMATKKNNALCVYVPEYNEAVLKSFRNFGNVCVQDYTRMNPLDVARYKYSIVVDPHLAIAFLESKQERSISEKSKENEKTAVGKDK